MKMSLTVLPETTYFHPSIPNWFKLDGILKFLKNVIDSISKSPVQQTENRLPETATASVQSETGNQEALMQNKKNMSCTTEYAKNNVFVMNIIYYTHP